MIEHIKPMEIEKRSFEIISELLGNKALNPENELVINNFYGYGGFLTKKFENYYCINILAYTQQETLAKLFSVPMFIMAKKCINSQNVY